MPSALRRQVSATRMATPSGRQATHPQVLMRSDWDGGEVIVYCQNEMPGAVMAFGDSGGILQLVDPQGQRRKTLSEAIDEEEDESE